MHSSFHSHSNKSQPLILPLADETATLALGEKIAKILRPGLVIFLQGDLGAGKTTLTRGILRAMGHPGKVKSPTYNLVEIYKFSRLYLYHFDFYRFDDPLEWEEAGFRDYFNADTICIIEWPEKAGKLIPEADITISFQFTQLGREICIQAGTETGKQCLQHW
ncbi:tRNA (adenosine(37)-N6)-threonylcarbamoyltransferase complex ATPase subunit type 1 TsaE [Nitrosomonas nitrosa]|uniref:tRNA (adenosine(37)-N6)-threonylcarbamoyltransferase complex ATPase subunit type 1 TsaE n=1 Tax=Nitrosomonas nitrosa TaxID=52442 RepID=UPI0023F82715|nr:tRNA (adenosine(37)-N6)-threonylcarbamoyltransferase complex ATPase subunit type 1 TsaE [Nitrosomonas nitrosa]